jgi:hypothetical protein
MLKLKQVYLLTLLFIVNNFFQVGLCQINKSNYSSYRTTADSIVRVYYGDKLMQFITLDSNRSYYRTLKINSSSAIVSLTERLEFEPEMFAFHYYFEYPSFKGDTLNIKFYIDKNHRIMEGFLPVGLFDMAGLKELKIISKAKALDIAKKSKIKKPLIKYEIELGWAEQDANSEDYKKYSQTKNIKDIVKGRIVWRVKSHFRDANVSGEKPYSEIFLIDAITGIVIGIEHEKLILS